MSQMYLCKHVLSFCLFFASITNLHATQAAPAAKQPEAPLTVTVVQTGAASREMFDRVLVKMMITNNSDRVFVITPPYFSNISFWNADNSKETVSILVYGTGNALKNMALATGWVLLAGAAVYWIANKAALQEVAQAANTGSELKYQGNKEPTLEQAVKYTLYFGLAIGAISEIGTLFRALKAKQGYAVTAHNTTTIQGYITQTALKKIQDGHLTPSPVAIALDNCEDEAIQLMYNAASTPKPTN
jgi:hypothetical protein